MTQRPDDTRPTRAMARTARASAARATGWLAWAALAGAALLAAGAVRAAPVAEGAPTLRPFKASFVLEWKGMNAATASVELAAQDDGSWRYGSRNNARGVFRAVFPDELTQVSRLQVESGQVRPLSYRGDDGSADKSRDIALDFDWNRRRVTGVAEKKPVDLELQAGLQDVMSVQIALIVDLLAGRKPTGYTLVDKDRIKDYVYTDEGKARVTTALGALDTVVWSSHRPNSDRVTRVWYAPSLGYAPVKAERRRGDRLEWSMRLTSLQR